MHTEETKRKISLAHQGVPLSEKHRKALSLAKKGGKFPWFNFSGGHHTEEARDKIAVYQKGRKRSAETKLRMSLSKMGQRPFLGKHHSVESKMKLSLANIGKEHKKGWKHSDEAKNKIALSAMGNLRNLGRKQSVEAKAKLSLSKAIRIQKVKGNIGPYKNHMFRSKWELLVAQNLDSLGIKWEYELQYFVLKSGRTYTPDFYTDFGWLEVKGYYFTKSAIEKLNMFVEEGNELFIIDERNINHPELYAYLKWEVR